MKPETDSAQKFIRLSEEALQEKDLDAMMALIEKRKTFLEALLQNSSGLSKAEVQECLKAEARLFARLDAERVKLQKEMDDLSGGRKAVRKYAPKSPTTTTPAFFDITT
jgi:cell division protein FtsB